MLAAWVWWAAIGCRREDPVIDEAEVRSSLVINEVLSHNERGWPDPDGPTLGGLECPEYDDYVELYNAGDRPLSLDGLTLSDSAERWSLPSGGLLPGERLLLVADEQPEQGPLHLPFGISAEGEILILAGAGGEELDRVVVPPMEADRSWARHGDGGSGWRPQAPSPGAPNEAPPDDPCWAPVGGFDDHTVRCVGTLEGFEALAGARAGLSVVKFDLLSFQDPDARRPVFLDTRFYALHDEWYLFRMLNGQRVEGEDLYPPYPGSFATIDEIYDWAAVTDFRALIPTRVMRLAPSGRLTSDRYYDLALGEPRVIGVGTLIHAPAAGTRAERWAFELEYGDVITPEEVAGYFQTLLGSLPEEIGGQLRWLVRSPSQEEVAQQMEAGDLPYADRLLRYSELSAPGEVEVYHEGTVAGRVRVIRAGSPIDSGPGDILVLEEIPDLLPPCAALITAVPQTPLAHIALLAESRGIPNLHVAGLTDDPQWDSWGRVGARVVIRATAPDGFEVQTISPEDWAIWQELQAEVVPALERVETDGLPWAVELASTPADELLSWRPILGGKSAGFLALLDAVGGEVEAPESPVGITVRAYHAQIDALGFVEPVLADPAFARPGDPRGRHLVLEGEGGYADRFAEPGDADYRASFLASHPSGTTLGDLIRAGGVRRRIEEAPIPQEILAEILPVLGERFGHYAEAQGLRFRSSSNVEDVEGFVGAGLYGSFTGYLDPEVAEQEDASVEQAIRRVWASYWGVEAFEERHAAALPHQNGGMGILVHANFPDTSELSNGVITATLLPDGGAEVVVNAQLGAISVTNPPTDGCAPILPEVAVIRSDASGAIAIERLQPSTERPDGQILDDASLRLLSEQGLAVVDRWLGIENAALIPEQRRTTLTLDLEYREMDSGWPWLASGAESRERLVLKQARSLEPAAAGLPDELSEAPFPRDLLARAQEITRVRCETAGSSLEALEVRTDPLLAPDLGYSEIPFTASLTLEELALDHLDWESISHPEGDWGIAVALGEEAALASGIASIAVADGELRVDDGVETRVERLAGPCAVETLWASPDSFLEGLLD